jgi:putative FmdB family regulatory protein
MFKLHEFHCNDCGQGFESLVKKDQVPQCSNCTSTNNTKLISATKSFTTIIPDYPGSKKKKAGYIHSHGDKPKTPGKIQVGYTGS